MPLKIINANTNRSIVQRNPLRPGSGFTLVELLVAASIIPLLIIVVSQLFISQVSVERKLLASQSAENFRSRLSFIIESDVADGRRVIGEVPTSAEAVTCPQETDQIFAVFSPYLTPSPEVVSEACIFYTFTDGQLIRKGPPIQQNGSLDYTQVVTEVVASGVDVSNLSINPTKTKITMDLKLPGFLGSADKSYTVSYGTKNLKVGS